MSHAPHPAHGSWTLALVIFSIIALIAFFYDTQREAFLGVINSGTTTVAVQSPYYKVSRVVDGDTLVVDYNGTQEKVRLIGINTPETVDPRKIVECFGKEASARMKDLAEGKFVRLETDSTQSSRDIYGRMLDYVYLEDGEMLNRKMIAEGYAYEYTYMTPYKYQKDFRDVQNIARISARGLWAADTCNGKKYNN